MIENLYSAAPEDAAAERLLSRDGIGRLAAAGMEIGFHTLHHPVLPDLDGADLVTAVREGRPELEATIGRHLRFFSYPHGRTDERVARAVAEVGYSAAFG